MAKTRRNESPRTKTDKPESAVEVESTLTAYAESLGHAMGNLRNHVDAWKGQRKHLVDQLSRMVGDAQALLADLGHSASEQVARVRRRGRPKKYVAAASNPAGAMTPEKRRKSKITPAGRAAISAAQRARWAAVRKTPT